jgi:hypothetical protein
MNLPNRHEHDVESLALWLHWLASSTGNAELLSQLIRSGVREVAELYGPPNNTDDDMPTLVERFAREWEECENLVRRDGDGESSHATADAPVIELPNAPPILARTATDEWGFALGSQAAEINALLTGTEYRSINEVFEQVATRFPTITRARVNSHIQVLRHRFRPFLHEQRQGRNVSFRLALQTPLANAAG